MQLYHSILIGAAIISLFAFIFWISVYRRKDMALLKIHDASLTCEELEEHAKEIAFEHIVSKKPGIIKWPVIRMNENYAFIANSYKILNEDVRKKCSIPPAAEWLLDNFYIIEEQTQNIRRDYFSTQSYAGLPVLKCGRLRGYARAYAIAMELVSHTNGQLDEKIILNYIKAYQSHNILLDRELNAIPVMIRLSLIENIRYICEKIIDTHVEWRKADELIESIAGDKEGEGQGLAGVLGSQSEGFKNASPSFIEHLSYRLRKAGGNYARVLGYIDENMLKYGESIDSLTQKEHNAQAVNTVAIGNCIMSLKFMSSLDWVEMFEALSHVQGILARDPDGTYPLMDLTSREQYRKKVEELSGRFNMPEVHVANEAIELARLACSRCGTLSGGEEHEGSFKAYIESNRCKRFCHVGYYLIGKGEAKLKEKIGHKSAGGAGITAGFKSRRTFWYMASIAIVAFAVGGLCIIYARQRMNTPSIPLLLLTAAAVLIPTLDISVNAVNWAVCKIFKPSVFPRLEFKEGIPPDCATVVVIPALLPDEGRVKELLENLERHFLCNKEENLYFALAGDFKDAPRKEMPGDAKIIEEGINGVRDLNDKYRKDGEHEVFYFFHRERQFNDRQEKWMGWERKRGALVEFNDMLAGEGRGSYLYSSSDSLPLGIRYVITLDADTIIPIDGAKKLIGTIAHPLNTPLADYDRGIVTEGYGLIQPRISFDVESANKSVFSRIFTGQEGIDPYSCAISDVYQDLFGEGIFTGKGIYDVVVFRNVLKNAIPENAVLSHDILEGSYVRVGLSSDLELIDSYPSRYNSYAARMHRWVRGDWQLIPWLCTRVRDKDGTSIRNPLSAISKWKIADNIRRSLLAPGLVLVIALGLTLLPGSALFWLGLAALAIALPLITYIADSLASKPFGLYRIKRHVPVISGLKSMLLQEVLLFMLLPYQACLMVHAIATSLIRVFITRRNMLEWITAADVEKGQKNSLESYYFKMKSSFVTPVILLILSMLLNPSSLALPLLLLALWGAGPFVAYGISRESREEPPRLEDEDILELRKISRKIWRYFEEFVNSDSHFLPPDNYQEDPPNGVARRTSPTNIGLGMLASLAARDLGYIGTHEMTGIILNTVSAIEKMEKWNGHLYNWYDTSTLEPLRPRYISTVDSGNLVCYLITLAQGLRQYLNMPLADPVFIKGIRDTAELVNSESGRDVFDWREFGDIAPEGRVDLILWSRALERSVKPLPQQEKVIPMPQERTAGRSRWKTKFEYMIAGFKRELSEYMPWLKMLESIPGQDKRAREAINPLLDNVALKNMPEAGKKAIDNISVLMGERDDGGGESREMLAWLGEMKALIEKAVKNSEELISKYKGLIDKIQGISYATKFAPLYVEKKQLFSIGYNIEEGRLTNSFYDLLASEARQTSYVAIARGEVPAKHWFRMGRALTVVDRYKGLVSWTGTMFEYLMPALIMKTFKNTLMDETYSFAVRCQKKYGRQRQAPWGASESAFYSLDINLDYQYKAVGVPWLGLKRGLIQDIVVAPYSTFLALPVDPECAVENIKRLKNEGMDGAYGYYEAIDYTPERIPFGSKKGIVKSFMVHHQGMSLLALDNFLNKDIMQKRFHSEPEIKAAELLLQEKVPTNIVFAKDDKEKIEPFRDTVYKEKAFIKKYTRPDTELCKVHMLSNGSYSVMITDRGTGFSRNKSFAVTRWREDRTLDSYGIMFYIRDINTNKKWSATYAPYNKLPEKYEVVFTQDKARFTRRDGKIQTQTEIIVASGDNTEIRRLSLKNNGEEACMLEITSYLEAVIAPHAADVAHPSFSNLFVRTEFLPSLNTLVANRRPRSEKEKSIWLSNTLVIEGEKIGQVQYETDRMKFIGRGNYVFSPDVIENGKPLSNSEGDVLDPIMSLRTVIKVEAGQTARISCAISASETRDRLFEMIEKYSAPEGVEEGFRLALTRSQVETKYLNMDASEIELYHELIAHMIFISPLKRLHTYKYSKGQSSLWPYGISGDLPVMLVILKKTDEMDIVHEALKAHEYWRLKSLAVDMVILNEEETSYVHPLSAILSDVVSSSHAHDILNKPGGVFILNRNNIPDEDIGLFHAVARIVLRGSGGRLSQQVKSIHQTNLPELKEFNNSVKEYKGLRPDMPELQYFNGLGGFSRNGAEYVIRLEKEQKTPLPWTNIISNPEFGFLVSESGGGYTWSENSRENKLTPWSNDPVSDPTGEIIYIRDNYTGEVWTITPLPIRENEAYIITHGFGYSSFRHISHGIEQNMTVFVPVGQPVKINLISIKNLSGKDRNLAFTYYIRPVMGVSDQATAMHINTFSDASGALIMENPYNEEFAGRASFIDSSEAERTVTGDRNEFFGSGNVADPEALRRKQLSGALGRGYDPCAVIQVNVELRAGEEREFVFILGQVRQKENVAELAARYRNVNYAKESLKEVKNYWKEKLDAVKVDTPDMSMNYIINGWLLYQTISCRIWARSGFYQSGGAYGFRDQLQDSISLMHIWPELGRSQILLHARHQFKEGDVQHWWHEPTGKGTRTRISDDLLWLPFATAEYIRISGDTGILDEAVPFLEAEPLKPFEDEKYIVPGVSSEVSTLYEHCMRAIERSMERGMHGIPLMGAGDWNDGMNTVGNKGKGESIWLGWFLYSVLLRFSPICRSMGDEQSAEKYEDEAKAIAKAIEENAWDGSWYRRAYFDNGVPLGSSQNRECQIDSISQSWSVISGGGNRERAAEAMASVDRQLVRREEGLVKLLAPPFDGGELEPGYIKGYLPGVRENGGQYTHAAAWVIIAFAKLGEGDKAWELFQLINPINHSRTYMEYLKYKAEPYVMPADVYGVPPHTGRGGWTWYTGSSGWMYRAGLEYILGFGKNGGRLIIDPCIPPGWSGYSIRYRYMETFYDIVIKNPDGVSRGVKHISVDGILSEGNSIELANDRKEHFAEVLMGESI